MSYWQNDGVSTALLLGVLLLTAEVLRRVLPPLRRAAIPGSIVAGILGLLLGPDLLDLLPFNREILEGVVYHGLAIVFISLGLQSPQKPGQAREGIRAFAFAIPFMIALQAVLGLAVVLALGLLVRQAIHPGIGAMLPLGFEEGPGQALALGAAWEKNGMADGAQVGLIVAAIGYAWAVLVGVPLVAWGRKRRLPTQHSSLPPSPRAPGHETAAPPLPAGSLDLLTRQVVAIAGCYALTYGICLALSQALASMPDIAATVWGFHFMIGAGVALAMRPLLARLEGENPLHTPSLGRLSGFAVDVMTCAALAAIQIAVLKANWLPILLVTTVGGVFTLLVSLWLSSRAFPKAPFEHCIVWFGMSTGTLPMGLALLRIIDPELRSPAPIAAVLGSGAAVPFIAPLLLLLIPGAALSSTPAESLLWLGASLAYALLLLALWCLFGGLRGTAPLSQLWARSKETLPSRCPLHRSPILPLFYSSSDSRP